ncbi:MAG: energy-coupling factor transporter ATPase [Oscillospiraceae bacterium]|nr:energy-coupling factor transporter ATPase [Oscillospiraceae bacterium]
MSNIIEIRNLVFKYINDEELETVALDGIDLNIEEGSFVVVLGHNGSGKSTLAKHLNGILQPTEGTVLVAGMDTRDEKLMTDIRRKVGMVFQNPDNQIVANVVEDDVAFGPENLGIESEEIRRRVDEALKAVDMWEFRSHAPHLLSGGQKQRVAIAGVIAMRPHCIVLDEPTAMLDPVGRAEVIETIMRLNKEQGITVVLITHHMSETIDADRLIVMADGRIIDDGTPQQVFANVQKLRDAGLSVPETTQLIFELRKEGVELPLSALSVDECAESIFKAFA